MWLVNDQGACTWPGDAEPELANLIKVVHYGWHLPGHAVPPGWHNRTLPYEVSCGSCGAAVDTAWVL